MFDYLLKKKIERKSKVFEKLIIDFDYESLQSSIHSQDKIIKATRDAFEDLIFKLLHDLKKSTDYKSSEVINAVALDLEGTPVVKKSIFQSTNSQSFDSSFDWEEAIKNVVIENENTDIKLILGCSSWIIEFLTKIEIYFQKPLRLVFPNLKYFIETDEDGEYYREHYQRFFPHRKLMKINLLTINGVSFALKSESSNYTLHPKTGFDYMLKDSLTKELISINQGLIGANYQLTFKNRYNSEISCFKKPIKIQSLNPFQFEVVETYQPIKDFKELRINKKQIIQVIDSLNEIFRVEDFFVGNVESTLPGLVWVLCSPFSFFDIPLLEKTIEAKLVELNPGYKDLVLRNLIQHPKVQILTFDEFYRVLKDKNQYGGYNRINRIPLFGD